jgi:hypothetical protein
MQQKRRVANHLPSAHSQAPKGKPTVPANVSVGDLIYIKGDGSKHVARDKYIVTNTDRDHLFARKLVGSQFRAKSYELKYTEVYPVSVKCLPPLSHACNPAGLNTDPYASDTSGSGTAEEDEPPPIEPLVHAHAPLQAPDEDSDEHEEDVTVPQPGPRGAIQTAPLPVNQFLPGQAAGAVDLEPNNAGLRRSSRQARRPTYLQAYDT